MHTQPRRSVRRAGERERGHPSVRDQCRSRLAVALHKLDDVLGQPRCNHLVQPLGAGG